MADYYELLEVPRTAPPEAIRAAITAQRRIWVRRQSSPDLERRAEAEGTKLSEPEQPVEPSTPEWPPRGKPGPRVIWERPDAEDYHLDKGKWDVAITEYEYVLERDPDNVDAALGLAAVHSASGRIEAELRPLEQAVAANPRDLGGKQTLVTALYDSAIVTLSYGPRIGSRRQWRIVGDRLRRIRRLRMKDSRTKVLVDQLKELRQRVRRMRWEIVISPAIYVALVVASLLPAVVMGGSGRGLLRATTSTTKPKTTIRRIAVAGGGTDGG